LEVMVEILEVICTPVEATELAAMVDIRDTALPTTCCHF
jgi:hypothetical protein